MQKINLMKLLSLSAAAIVFSGCSSTTLSTENVTQTSGYHGTTDISVNGEMPKGKVGATFNTIMEETDNKGMTRTVVEIVRKPGYRSAVHYMTYATTSCVLKGQATLVMDGSKPQTYKTGQCFIMPEDIKGYIVNNGKTMLKLLDYNTAPEGQDTMVMLED